MTAEIILLGMIGGFFTLLLVKSSVKKSFCALCVTVSLTGIALIIAWSLDWFHEPIVIAILMGESIVGLLHFLEKRLKESLLIFRFPYLLTATFGIVFLLNRQFISWEAFAMLGALWLIFFSLFFFQTKPLFGQWARKIIACCKNW